MICSYCSKNVYTIPVRFIADMGKVFTVPYNCWRNGRNACKEKCDEKVDCNSSTTLPAVTSRGHASSRVNDV